MGNNINYNMGLYFVLYADNNNTKSLHIFKVHIVVIEFTIFELFA